MPAFLLPLALGAAGLTGAGLTWWGTRSANNQTKQNYNQDQLDFEQQLQLQDRDFENQLKLADINQGYGQENMEAQFNLLGRLKNIEQEQQMLQLKFLQPFAAAENEANRKNLLEQQLLANKATLGAAGINADATKYGAGKQLEGVDLQSARQLEGVDLQSARQLEGIDLQSRRQLEAALDTNATTKYGYDLNHDAALKELARLRDADKFNLYANLFNGLGNFAFRG